MQPMNSYNNQNGMGRNVGVPMYPEGVQQNQSNMYVSPQEPMYQPQPVRRYPQPNPWDNQNWREVEQAPQSSYHIPFRGMSISDPSEIKPKDVPMDGHMSFFPLDDYSAVYAKVWTDDGRLRTFRFIPELEAVAPPETPSTVGIDEEALVGNISSSIANLLSPFEKRLEKIEKSVSSALNQIQTPKEAAKK